MENTPASFITMDNYKEVLKIARKIHIQLNPHLKEKQKATKREWDKKKREEDPEYRKKHNERSLNYYHSNPEYRKKQTEKSKERYAKLKELAQLALQAEGDATETAKSLNITS